MRQINVPVLIVGGGGAGLTASLLLADLGVESLLIERHPSTSNLPKAHYINQRSMEIFRLHGMADTIYQHGAPRAELSKIHWQTSVGGDGDLDRVVFFSADAMGGGGVAAEYDLKGTTRPTNIPQIRLEPLLRTEAERRNPGRVLFNHELKSFTQDAQGVDAVVMVRDTEEQIRVRAQYMIAADGGKTVGPALGIKMVGATQLADYVSIHITADLSQYIKDDDSVMRMIVHPNQSADKKHHVGGLLTLGPTHWDRHSEEWAVGWGYSADDPERYNEDNIVPRIKEFLKVDVPIKVHYISHYWIEAVVADSFRAGRIFIAGDAAHKHTPNTGLGLNSGIQDVHNLCWKLALVLNGKASDTLLDSYESERRPVVERNAEWSLFTLGNHATLMSALGLMLGAPAEQNENAFRRFLAPTTDGRSRRARFQEVAHTQRIEYSAHDMEMGFQYQRGALVDDGKPWPERDPMGVVYTPSSHPGCRLPHAWLRRDTKAVSTHDLMPMGGFVLLTGNRGKEWIAASHQLAAELGIPLHAYSVGDNGADVQDPSSAWRAAREIAEDGAILVRPDSYVAFRSESAVADPLATLRAVFAQLLS